MNKIIILLAFLGMISCNKEEKTTEKELEEDAFFQEIEQMESRKNTDLIIGSKMPYFKLKDINGNDFDVSEVKESHILIDFWTYWCPPCVEENKHLLVYKEKYPSLKIISIHEDPNLEKWKSEVLRQNLSSLILLDDSSKKVGDLFGVEAYPVQFLIDNKREIIEVQKGGGSTFIADKLKQIFSK